MAVDGIWWGGWWSAGYGREDGGCGGEDGRGTKSHLRYFEQF